MKDSKYYRKKMQEKNKNKFAECKWLTKLLLSIIIVLICLIVTNFSVEIKNSFKNYVLEQNLNFGSINKLYDKYVDGGIENSGETIEVVNESDNTFSNIKSNGDGTYSLSIERENGVLALNAGLIVFIGDKDNLSNTVIIQGNDGIDIWYSNVSVTEYSLYDYVSKGDILGLSLNDNIILTIMKDGNKLTYEEYFKEN